jgi:hypothetical protein
VDADQRAERQPEIERRQQAGRGAVEQRGAVLAAGHQRDRDAHQRDRQQRRQVHPRHRHRGTRRQRGGQRRQVRQHRADAAGQPRVLVERQAGDGERHDQQLRGRQPPHERQGAKREREAAQQTGHVSGLTFAGYLAAAATGTDAMPP